MNNVWPKPQRCVPVTVRDEGQAQCTIAALERCQLKTFRQEELHMLQLHERSTVGVPIRTEKLVVPVTREKGLGVAM